MKKQILTLLFGLQLLTIAGTAFANETVMLPKLKKIADATKWEYSVTQYGQPSFSVKLDNGDNQEVYIHNQIYTYGNTNYYFVCGTICTTDEKPSEAILLDAMTTNGTRFATISLMDREFPHYKGNDNKYSDTAINSGVLRWGMRATLMCCADSGSEGLKKVISQVAEDANTFKKKHFSQGKDNSQEPIPAIKESEGTAIAKEFFEAQQKLRGYQKIPADEANKEFPNAPATLAFQSKKGDGKLKAGDALLFIVGDGDIIMSYISMVNFPFEQRTADLLNDKSNLPGNYFESPPGSGWMGYTVSADTSKMTNNEEGAWREVREKLESVYAAQSVLGGILERISE